MEAARFATESDIARIVKIGQAHAESLLAEAQRGAEEFLTRDLEPVADTVARLIGSGESGLVDGFVVVGTFEEVVFGYAACEYDDDTSVGRLVGFVVEKEARKVGIGEAMFDLVAAELKALGCRGIDSYALPGDRDTKNFFESFGLKARLLTVYREL